MRDNICASALFICVFVLVCFSSTALAIELPPPTAAATQPIGFTNTPDRALGPYIGLGHLRGTVSSSNDVIGTQDGSGFIFYTGFPFNKWAAFELTAGSLSGLQMGETSDRYYPPSSAEYGFFGMGLKLNLAKDSLHPFVPWIQAGVSAEMITWDEYWYSITGGGSYVALGVDWYPAQRHSLRVEWRRHSFTGESDAYLSDKYPVDVEMFGVSYAFHFRGYGFGAAR